MSRLSISLSCIVRPLAIGLAAAAFSSMSAGAPARAQAAEDMPLAERIEQCATCHGEDGNSQTENIPSLAGQPEFYVMNQLILMREGVRPIEVMKPFVEGLDDQEIVALARHYASLPPKRTPEPVDPELAERGEQLAAKMRCASCHVPSLAGQEQMPRLAGQRIDYMIQAMKAYRDDQRQGADTAMSAVLYGASDKDIEALAHYAASR